jgi:hypothetical protein
MVVPQPSARYLGILGLAAGAPDLEHLRALVAAQLMRVPFENVSKLYLKKRFGATSAPTLEQHLDGIERFRFGGTCYANNPHFYACVSRRESTWSTSAMELPSTARRRATSRALGVEIGTSAVPPASIVFM